MNILLFEDHLTAENRPVTLPRPAFDVGMAGTTLFRTAGRYADNIAVIVRDYLKATSGDHPGIAAALPDDEPLLCLNASLAPGFETIEPLINECVSSESFIVQNDSQIGAAFFPNPPAGILEQNENEITSYLLQQGHRKLRKALPLVHYPFEVIKYHQKFFDANLEKIKSDFAEEQTDVYMGKGVEIHPTAIIEPAEGPIVLEDGVSVGPFAHIVGPAIIGRGSRVIERATVEEQVQIEHTCKVGGEIECSIMEPYSNKQHHGFMGHSYIGSWVNMGAGTSNSDLKNTYGTVSIQHGGEKIDTEMQFLGCIIGDYSKTAINTSIFTGKIIGVSSFLYGLVGTNVPSFTNYARSLHQQTEIPPDVTAKVQKRMFKRRDVEQTDSDIILLETMYKLTRNERLLSDEPLAF